MSWFVALLWLVSGLLTGAFGFAYLIVHGLRYPMRRLEVFRLLAKHFPEDYERALLHTQVVGHGNEDEEFTLEPIEFGLCEHCLFPWPIDEGKLITHPIPTKMIGTVCPGSETKDYHVEK